MDKTVIKAAGILLSTYYMSRNVISTVHCHVSPSWQYYKVGLRATVILLLEKLEEREG